MRINGTANPVALTHVSGGALILLLFAANTDSK